MHNNDLPEETFTCPQRAEGMLWGGGLNGNKIKKNKKKRTGKTGNFPIPRLHILLRRNSGRKILRNTPHKQQKICEKPEGNEPVDEKKQEQPFKRTDAEPEQEAGGILPVLRSKL